MKFRATASADARYSFGPQFFAGAAAHAKLAQEVEHSFRGTRDEDAVTLHRSYVVAAVMQSVAGLEATIWEVTHYGPGQHLGSNGNDPVQSKLLKGVAEIIDRANTLGRFDAVLHLLGKQTIDRSGKAWDDANLTDGLRDEITHYESRWGSELDRVKLLKGLKAKKFARPPWVPDNGVNFFPHQCLGAECAIWAVRSSWTFLDEFYRRLEIASPLESIRNKRP